MNNELLIHVLEDHFKEEPEVNEVVMYAVSKLAINDAIMSGMMSKSTELVGIPPDAYYLCQRFESGLTTNKFWINNFAPIKMQLTLEDIKYNTLRNYINFAESSESDPEGHTKALKQSRSILLSRLDVLTTIAFLWKGVDFAEKFDSKVKIVIQLSDEHEQYFKGKGI